MGNVLLKRTTAKKILKSKSTAKLVKDKNGIYHCSKCGAFISG